MSAILPGATIGILGGGQLGRMTAMAARSLGYRVQAMDPDPSCPARFVVDACFEGGWDDVRTAANLARGCDVVTLEIEQIAIASMEAAQKFAPVRPGPELLRMVQDRILQKNWLKDHGFPVGEFRAAETEEELVRGISALGGQCFVKSTRGGYDGRSQVKTGFEASAKSYEEVGREVWALLGKRPCLAEKAIELELEVSVMVARSPSGQVVSFPSAANHHENQILAWSVLPSSIAPALESEAQRMAVDLAHQLALEGLLAVEMFVTKSGTLLINELAPRPHNSYHTSERACVTSQFEQAVRAVCDLPLGETSILRPAAIANLLGDLWLDHEPKFDLALRIPGVGLHLYEKSLPRKGRKMGHLSAVGVTPMEAVERVLKAQQLL